MQAQYKTYDSYKDSGVEWISQIPREWETRSVRAIFIDRNEKNDPIKTKDILSLSIAEGVTPYSDENRGGNKAKNDLSAYKLAYPNDIVLNSMNVVVGAVGLSKYFGAISPVYYALRARNSETDIHFYEKVFKNQSFQRYLLKFGKGILIKEGENGKLNTIRMKISRDDLKTVVLPFPPIDTQNRIAAFLDQKTAEIDAAIEKKQRLIELLKEQKSILINQAVTKGLTPNAPMKDSGIEWIGQIPVHWEVKRLKNVLSDALKYGANEEANECVEGDPRYIRITDFADDGLLKDDTRRTLPSKKANSYLLSKGDILLARSGATVGKSFIYDSDEPACFAGYLIRARANDKEILPYYLYLYTKSPVFTAWKEVTFSKATIQNIGADKYAIMPIIAPPIAEQISLLEWIAVQSEPFDRFISNVHLEIQKLQEFKQTLIAHAVTGKIKV